MREGAGVGITRYECWAICSSLAQLQNVDLLLEGGGLSCKIAFMENANNGSEGKPPYNQNCSILFMDTKGSSQLSASQTVRFVEWLRGAVLGEYERIRSTVLHLNTWGDGLIVVSSSAPKLAEFAIRLQSQFEVQNWKSEETEIPVPIQCRIALHQGIVYFAHDKLLDRENVSGKEVVTAARLEPKVEPGQIWTTKAFSGQAQSELSENFEFVPIGQKELDKKAGPVHVDRLQRKGQNPVSRPSVQGQTFVPGQYGELESRWIRILTTAPEKRDWLVSAGTLHSARKIVEMSATSSGRLPAPLKVSCLRIKKLSSETVKRLVNAEVLDPDFEKELHANLKALEKHKARLGDIVVTDWKGLPPFHGFLFGDVAHIGQWTLSNGRLDAFTNVELFEKDESGTIEWMLGELTRDQ